VNVADHFLRSPFVVRGGGLEEGRGEGEFTPYASVLKLKSTVEATFERPVSFRLVVGNHGYGKTWTLSWLWREFSREIAPRRCLVLGVPRFEIQRRAERSMVESILRCVQERHPELFMTALANAGSRASEDLRSLRDHFANFESREILMGNGGARVRATEQTRGFSLTLSRDLTRILEATFEAALHAGYPRCLVLVDEFEAPFILGSPRERTIFSEFLRGVYDGLIAPTGGKIRYPRVQFLFSGTEPVFREFAPAAITRQIDRGGLMAAFLRRTEPPFFIEPPSTPDLKRIAQAEIARTRKHKEQGFIPFDEGALLEAWKRSTLNLGEFVRMASDMYLLAEEEGANAVTTAHLRRVMEQYKVGSESKSPT
jgi:hypothetical protein